MKMFQLSLKLGGALVMAITLLFALPSGPAVQGKGENSLTATPAITVEAEFDIGRKKKGCTGTGVCAIIVRGGTVVSDRTVRGELSTDGDGRVTMRLLGKPPEEGPTLFIDEDIAVPAEIAKKLGLKSATVLRGEYPFSSRRAVLNARLTK